MTSIIALWDTLLFDHSEWHLVCSDSSDNKVEYLMLVCVVACCFYFELLCENIMAAVTETEHRKFVFFYYDRKKSCVIGCFL